MGVCLNLISVSLKNQKQELPNKSQEETDFNLESQQLKYEKTPMLMQELTNL